MAYLLDDVNEVEELVRHLATLYDQGEPCVDFDGDSVSDSEYDRLVSYVRDNKPDSDIFAKGTTSPSAYLPGGNLVTHNPPMTSIAKADGEQREKKYESWVKECCTTLGYEYPPQPGRFSQAYKRDGVAMRVYYQKGKLVRAGLRSVRGVDGTDVTANVKYVKGVPETLKLPLTLALSGEIECWLDDFEKVQKEFTEKGEKIRANPRNHSYGSINQHLDPKKTAEGRLRFTVHNIVGFDDYTKYYETAVEQAKWANTQLLPDANFVQVKTHNFDDLQKMEDGVADLNYEVDGVVLRVNNLEDQEQLGHTGDDPVGDPRGMLAWKFTEQAAEAIAKEIHYKASRTGRIPPVVIFEKPIRLAGTMVSRATASNIGWMKRMGIGVGSKVKVIKAGKIIPKVIEVIGDKATKFDIPTHCPTCQSDLKVELGDHGNEDLLCPNKNCAAKHVAGIEFFLKTIGAKGLGYAMIEQMLDSNKVSDLADIYTLTVEDLVKADFSSREALKALATIHMIKPSRDDTKLVMDILNARREKKKIQAWQFFAALGIKRAGKTAGKLLVDQFRDFDKIRSLTFDELKLINGVGEVMAQSIVDYFTENKQLVDRLLNHIELELPKTGRLTGQSFVFSGSFEGGKEVWEKAVEELGGKISGSVSKKTTYLVAGPGSGSKSEKAKEYGVQILSLDELKKLL